LARAELGSAKVRIEKRMRARKKIREKGADL
jgi:hypothetical protein